MTIRNKEDVRAAYRDIRFFQSLPREGFEDPTAIDKITQSWKRSIRKYYKKQDAIMNNGHRVIKSDFDGFLELVELPRDIESETEAADYFYDYEYIHYRPTYYDCTGQAFTSWFKVFRRNGRWMAYHSVGRDI